MDSMVAEDTDPMANTEDMALKVSTEDTDLMDTTAVVTASTEAVMDTTVDTDLMVATDSTEDITKLFVYRWTT